MVFSKFIALNVSNSHNLNRWYFRTERFHHMNEQQLATPNENLTLCKVLGPCQRIGFARMFVVESRTDSP